MLLTDSNHWTFGFFALIILALMQLSCLVIQHSSSLWRSEAGLIGMMFEVLTF
jgi:hypothetical protein